MDRSILIKMGGGNEGISHSAHAITELVKRINIMGGKVVYTNGDLFHIDHVRVRRDSRETKALTDSYKEYLRICNSSKKYLESFYKIS